MGENSWKCSSSNVQTTNCEITMKKLNSILNFGVFWNCIFIGFYLEKKIKLFFFKNTIISYFLWFIELKLHVKWKQIFNHVTNFWNFFKRSLSKEMELIWTTFPDQRQLDTVKGYIHLNRCIFKTILEYNNMHLTIILKIFIFKQFEIE